MDIITKTKIKLYKAIFQELSKGMHANGIDDSLLFARFLTLEHDITEADDFDPESEKTKKKIDMFNKSFKGHEDIYVTLIMTVCSLMMLDGIDANTLLSLYTKEKLNKKKNKLKKNTN